MKHLKHLFTVLLLLCTSIANAHDFEVDGIYYYVTNFIDREVMVTYKGSSFSSYSNEYTGSVVIPRNVTYNGKNYLVESIDADAFRGCSNLTSVEIPSSVTSIGQYAFYKCSSLTSIIIPYSVTYIGSGVFDLCENLKTVINFSKLEFTKGAKDYGGVAYYAERVFNVYNGFIDGDFICEYSGSTVLLSGYLGYTTRLVLPVDYNGGKYAIGNAFKDNTDITSVIVPYDIKLAGIVSNAFDGCINLKTVINFSNYKFTKGSINSGKIAYYADRLCNLPNGSIDGDFIFGRSNGVNSLLLYLGNESDLVLPDNCNGETYGIGDEAFNKYLNLNSVIIGNNVTGIGNRAFNECANLSRVTIGNSVVNIADAAFKGCHNIANIEIPNSVTFVGDSVFSGCAGLVNVIIGDNVTTIGESAFNACSSIERLEFSNSITSIGNFAFNGCTSLKELSFEDGGAELSLGYNTYNSSGSGKGLFYDCPLETLFLGRDLSYDTGFKRGYSPFYKKSSLKSVTIGDRVTSIGESLFEGCNNLESAIIGNSVTHIGELAFAYCVNLGCVTIGDSVVSIGKYAFIRCENLASIEIPNSVASIGDGAFESCKGFKNLEIPNSVTYIGEQSFAYCFSLTNLIIPNSITSIGGYAFRNCIGLTNIESHIFAEDLFAIDTTVFDGFDKNACTLYVPIGAKDTYAATTGWSGFINIEEVDFTGINEVDAENGKAGTIYDLKGCVVENPTNGIFIINGKKIFVK